MRRGWVLMAAAMLGTAVPALVQAQASDPSTATVRTLDDALLSLLQNGRALGFAGRSARIAPVIDRTFDLPLITRLSVGLPWTTMNDGDKAQLIAAVRRLTIAQYAHNFDAGTGSFAINPAVQVRGTDRIVQTTLTSGGDRTALAYRLRQSGGGEWRIVDVFYQNSISQLATRRADFARIVASGGAAALVQHLNRLSDQAAR